MIIATKRDQKNDVLYLCDPDFNDQSKVFRVHGVDALALKDYYDLQVNYNSSIVNHHSIELFILDPRGTVVKEFSGVELSNHTIVNYLEKEIQKNRNLWARVPSMLMNAFLPLLMLFFPKFPMCWAGYLSLFGLSGISWLKYNPATFWLLVAFSIMNLYFMFRQAKKRGFYLPVWVASFGYLVLVTAFVFDLFPLI